MEKFKLKDINEYLSFKSRIKIAGRNTLSMAGNFVNSIKNAYTKSISKAKEMFVKQNDNFNAAKTNFVSPKGRLNEYVAEEADLKIQEEIETIEAEEELLKSYEEEIYSADEITKEHEVYADELDEKLKNLKKKKIRRKSRGLGIFSLSKIALTKFSKHTAKRTRENLIKQKEAIIEKKNKFVEERKLSQILKKESKLKKEYNDLSKKVQEFESKTGKEFAYDLNHYEDVKVIEPETYEVLNVKEPKDKGKLKKSLAELTLIGALLLTIPATNHISKNIKNARIVNEQAIEQPMDKSVEQPTPQYAKRPEKQLSDKEEFDNNLHAIDDLLVNNILVGSEVEIDHSAPIYETGKDAVLNTNQDSHYFKDNAKRLVEELVYAHKNEEGKTVLTYIRSNSDKAKLQILELEKKGAELRGVLINKEMNFNTGKYEGYKNIDDIALVQNKVSKGLSR